MLNAWARAQINFAPGGPTPDDPVVISCAKNNDSTHFTTFAIGLNTETMLREVDENFDMEGWRQEVGGTMGSRDGVKPQILRELLSKGRDYEVFVFRSQF
jgi:hypothetical protein